jgi:hypothetical protein
MLLPEIPSCLTVTQLAPDDNALAEDCRRFCLQAIKSTYGWDYSPQASPTERSPWRPRRPSFTQATPVTTLYLVIEGAIRLERVTPLGARAQVTSWRKPHASRTRTIVTV